MNISTYKEQKAKASIFGKIGIFSASLLTAASAVYIYSPVIGSHAGESVTSRVSATINPVASVTLDTSDISFTFTPTASGVFDSKPVTATVGTNSTGGYELYFSSEDNETDMKNALSSVTNVIASDFTGTVTSETMAANKWGYSLNNTDFSKIPTLDTQATLKNIDHYPTTEEKTTTVNIGMKVDTNLPSGTYTKDLVFSVVAHETPPIPTMQDFDVSTLVNVGDSATLQDSRDGNFYTVKKLADGNIWMTENLRIAGKTITSADSDVTNDFTIPASSDSGFNSDTQDNNSAYVDSTYGGYYTFYTATAGTGGTNLASGNAPSSICPKGWRLPTGDSSGEFKALYNSYNSSALMQGEPNFTLSGGVMPNGSSVDAQGLQGIFWSSTVKDANFAYALAIVDSDFAQENNLNPDVLLTEGTKLLGLSVRCVAGATGDTGDTGNTGGGTTSGITMQAFDEGTMIPNTGDSMTLRDERDDNMYTVKRLADGKVWMTENLRLIDKAISSVDSNLPEGRTYTVPASDLSSFADTYGTSAAYLDSTYGGYYNFYTATAGWGTDSVTFSNSPKDICPKGWRLPTGGDSGQRADEFEILYNNYKSSALMQGDPNFTLSGRVGYGSVIYQGSYGMFWSSRSDGNLNAYELELDSSHVMPTANGDKLYGRSVRCVAKDKTISEITMQTFDEGTMILNTGDSMTLRDERDDNMYTVKRLADGKVWMTENLRLINKTISSADSNLPSGETYTVPVSDASSFTTSYNTNSACLDSTYGGHYSFYTATAGWGTDSVASGNSPKDICPKGWRLPTGGSSGEFSTLYGQYNSASLMTDVPNFTFSGFVVNGSVSLQDDGGSYWSSTVTNATNAYNLYLHSSGVNQAVDDNKYYGFSVRCVAQ